jgi:hypothetical protein
MPGHGDADDVAAGDDGEGEKEEEIKKSSIICFS